MPEVARFYGIVVKMFFKPKEHEPSHIHAIYGEYIGIFDLATLEMSDGDLPSTAQRLVKEWLVQHQDKLKEMWETQQIIKLPPLWNMIPRIASFEPMADYKLLVNFDEGRTVIYDVGDDIRQIEAFEDLKTIPRLFENASLDSSRTCIVWNDRIDLPSDTIYEYGRLVGSICEMQ